LSGNSILYSYSSEYPQAEQNALGASITEKAMLNAVAPQAEPSIKRKKGPKGPNPLSVKKKAPKHRIQEIKTTVAVAAQVKGFDAENKRKRRETDGGDLSTETEPRPKRRRRQKSSICPVEPV
jgi:U3 small nucleolar RNA-associated protein 23